MLKRTIYLKRNSFILQLLMFFPLVFIAGVFSYLIHRTGFPNWDKIFLSVMFIVELFLAYKVNQTNGEFIQLADNEILVCKKGRKSPKVIETYTVDAIKSIVCDDKRKRIKFLYHNCPEKVFLKFKYSNLIGVEVYFQVKSELCRYYPTKTVDFRDDYVEEYIKTGTLPEYIKSRQFSEKCGAVLVLFFEFIFAIIPIGLTVLSVLWSICWICILIMKGLIFILNLFL